MPNGLPDLPLPPPLPTISPAATGLTATATPEPEGLMSQNEKAAVLMRILLNEEVRLSLKELPDSAQIRLTELMAGMRMVKRSVARDVANEFLREMMTIGLTNSRGIEGTLTDLEGVISESIAQRMRRDIGLKAISDPWQRLERLEDNKLRPMLLGESFEIAAVVLSKLSVRRAAELLSSLPGDVARKITWAMSMTGATTAEAIERIGLSLASQLDSHAPVAFDDAAEKRIGAILNLARPAVRDEVLESLEDQDQDFAREVRRSIFTFAHIAARLDGKDVSKVLRNIDLATQITAFAYASDDGADPDTRDSGDESGNSKSVTFLLSQMSSRLADTLREDMETLGKIKEPEGERAMATVVAELRRLADAGEIDLVEDEDTEPA